MEPNIFVIVIFLTESRWETCLDCHSGIEICICSRFLWRPSCSLLDFLYVQKVCAGVSGYIKFPALQKVKKKKKKKKKKNLHQQGPYKLSWPWHWSLLSHCVTVCIVGMWMGLSHVTVCKLGVWMGCHIADTVRVNIARWPLCKTCLKYEVKEDAEERGIQEGVMDSAMTQQYLWVIIFHHANIHAHGGEEEISFLSHRIVVFLVGGVA
jgi:hypothetical protein